ncbi:MAG: FHA domain-containing protein [Myxococcota bacterium]|nr:FHA domain-containing protein [Myxococcota bacterium]
MAAERLHVFLLLRRGGKPERVVVWDTQDITVGRESENDIVVNDPEMSRSHARFRKDGDAFLVDNLSNSNFTRVNGESVESQALWSKDVVAIGDTELVFFRVPDNPVTLGVTTEYASQLKGFGPKTDGDGEATVLGLMDPVVSSADDFRVQPLGDFDHELAGMSAPPLPQSPDPAPVAGPEAPPASDLDPLPATDLDATNLDATDLDAPPAAGLDELEIPAAPAAAAAPEAWTLDEGGADLSAFTFTVEVDGLTPEQRQLLGGLLDKVLVLPQLRIRLKSDDLG